MKTLIVDDEILNCKLLQSLLKDYGQSDIALGSGEALQIFQTAIESQEPYDLVCLDIMMPEKNGYEVLRAMRKLEQDAQSKKSRIIMVTVLDEEKDKKKALLGEDCDGYLVKPVEQKLLFEMLGKMNLISSDPA
jgi:two-component system chemotaxis response regulator CheY